MRQVTSDMKTKLSFAHAHTKHTTHVHAHTHRGYNETERPTKRSDYAVDVIQKDIVELVNVGRVLPMVCKTFHCC